MIEILWAGWRGQYLASLLGRSVVPSTATTELGDHDPRSVFTRLLESGLADEEIHVVHRSRSVFVILNAFPYSVGHAMVLPYRQVAELDELTDTETTDLWATVTRLCRAIRTEYAPHGLNVGINMGPAAGGSVNEHLHVHVVPRWTGDSNFLAATANAKAIPEALDVTATRLRAALRDPESESEPT